MVKLAVAIHRTVSASPGFDSRPMQAIFFVVVVYQVRVWVWVQYGNCQCALMSTYRDSTSVSLETTARTADDS